MKPIEKHLLLKSLPTQEVGIEISPLYRPATDRSIHNVHYTDYTSAEDSREKHAHYEHPEIMDLDFIWTPGKKLSECTPVGIEYHWAIASHVLEHVPDPIGWLLEVFEVMNEGGVFSLALPEKTQTFDRNRRISETSDLIHAWLSEDKRPNTKQLYDFLSKVTSEDGNGNIFSEHHYTKEEALNFTLNSYTTGQYFDAHCSVFTKDSFVAVINELNELGILNVKVSEPIEGVDEFYIQLKKVGEPKLSRPVPFKADDETVSAITNEIKEKQLEHYIKAYKEAIDVQDTLKKHIAELEKLKPSIWNRIFGR
ncbi:methyltransferase domain-containing protein [Dickeya chrysanthemi]|uniref:methyltransferase domain-containing protein n=1 Tax=Dickeya chrysanthemi TaxID=556 RepID=UPI0003A0A16E|nr:class I SAM-dependent methyltransferase [Dickeya chrysanthemi]MBX9447153.1 methyltransferase domain-containing protein [Dickeya chrysanthemi]